MVVRKSQFGKDSTKSTEKASFASKGRKPPRVNLNELEDAYQNGIWLVPVGGELLVEKKTDGKVQKSVCLVKKLEEGLIHAWDETFERWFLFNVASLEANNIVVKILKNH